MNNNFKSFLKEKKDLLIFVGVLVITFIGVIGIASYATKDKSDETGAPPNVETPEPNTPDPSTQNPPKVFTFALPIKGEYVITREFYDTTLPDTLVSAIKNNGSIYEESLGISYSRKDNAVFDVTPVYPGVVTKINDNPETLEGLSVTIEHDNGVTSVYSALSSITVKVGDKVSVEDKIGVSGTSIIDEKAGIHVHLELIQNDKHINPKDAVGKQTSELASIVK